MSDIKDQLRAKASAHIQLLHSQRQHPEQLLEKLRRAQPENSGIVDQIHEYINFNASRLESLLPDVSQDVLPSVNSAILDLIQNADDASYLDGCLPSISFVLLPDEVVLKYNDKGLTPEEVERICDLNRISGHGNDSREKKVGLRSAFKIASKVRIESNGYSFSFEFKKDDNVLKRLAPNPEESYELHTEGTRITLTLVEDEAIRVEALKRLKEFPSTFLLFSRNIKKLHILNMRDADPSTLSTHNKVSASQQSLTKSIFHDKKPTSTEIIHFHTTRQPNLPTKKVGKNSKNNGVMLAFPFNPDKSTLIKLQHNLFNRLPIDGVEVGFNFLIQADFATLADRETVDECSSWNVALLGEIAETFKAAIGEMCKEKSGPFQFKWMEYLPDNSVRSEFWKGLLPKIKDLLSDSSIFLSSSGNPELLRNLRHVPKIFRDKGDGSGGPLFEDAFWDDSKYLHPGYDKYLQILKDAGLRDLSVGEMMKRVRMDLLEARSDSRMRTITDEKWQERAAKFLTSCQSSSSDFKGLKSLKCIPIIPNNGCKWISGNMEPFYYPHLDNLSIPTDLNLLLLDPDATRSAIRIKLYEQLGAIEAPTMLVRELIMERYRRSTDVGRTASIAHLRYLWWTHTGDAKNGDNARVQLHVFNVNDSPILPSATDIFFDSDCLYGIRKLLPDEPNRLLHPAYLEVPPMKEKPGHPSWKEWLRDFVGVQDYPPLIDRDDLSKLSPIFIGIAIRRPEVLVGLLEEYWFRYQEWIRNPSIQKQVFDLMVTCAVLYGAKTTPKFGQTEPGPGNPLNFFNSVSVDEIYPFLNLPIAVTKVDEAKWDLMSCFGVTKEENLEFYLKVLSSLASCSEALQRSQFQLQEKVSQLYSRIQRLCAQDAFPQDALKKLRSYFTSHGLVFVQGEVFGSFSWSKPEDCRLDAPHYLRSKVPLDSFYTLIRCFSMWKMPTNFLRETLQIQSLTWKDLIEELEFIQSSGERVRFQNIQDIYVRLNSMKLADYSPIRERFESSKLIYSISEKSWKAPSSCVWSSKAPTSTKTVLDEQYCQVQRKSALEEFFIKDLNVEESTLEVLELVLVAKTLPGRVFSKEDIGCIDLGDNYQLQFYIPADDNQCVHSYRKPLPKAIFSSLFDETAASHPSTTASKAFRVLAAIRKAPGDKEISSASLKVIELKELAESLKDNTAEVPGDPRVLEKDWESSSDESEGDMGSEFSVESPFSSKTSSPSRSNVMSGRSGSIVDPPFSYMSPLFGTTTTPSDKQSSGAIFNLKLQTTPSSAPQESSNSPTTLGGQQKHLENIERIIYGPYGGKFSFRRFNMDSISDAIVAVENSEDDETSLDDIIASPVKSVPSTTFNQILKLQ